MENDIHNQDCALSDAKAEQQSIIDDMSRNGVTSTRQFAFDESQKKIWSLTYDWSGKKCVERCGPYGGVGSAGYDRVYYCIVCGNADAS